MKPVLRSRVPAEKLPLAVPPAYRDAVRKAARPEGQYSLLLFAHAPRDVVMSPPVRKALRRLGPPAADGVIAVGTVFTEEALALLREADARVVAWRKSKWTDESARQRQLKPETLGAAPQSVKVPCPPALDEATVKSPACVLAHADSYLEAAVPDDDGPGLSAEPGAGAAEDADHLLAGYADTNYFVSGLELPLHPGEPNAGLPGFLAAQGAKSLAVLTAYNPRSDTLPEGENEQRQATLEDWLEEAGLRWVSAEGRARDGSEQRPHEPLLAVFDAPPALLQRLMESYGQNAVIVATADAPPRLWLRPAFMRELAREEYAAG